MTIIKVITLLLKKNNAVGYNQKLRQHNVLSGIAEPSIDFITSMNCMIIFHLTTGSHNWAIPDKSVQITLEGDIAFLRLFSRWIYRATEQPEIRIFLNRLYLFEEPGNIYLKKH